MHNMLERCIIMHTLFKDGVQDETDAGIIWQEMLYFEKYLVYSDRLSGKFDNEQDSNDLEQ